VGSDALAGWCIAPILSAPLFCAFYPFRKADAKSRAARELALQVASGAAVPVCAAFSRKALAGGPTGSSCVESVLRKAFFEHDGLLKQAASSPYGRLAEWCGAMQRYADAMAAVEPAQAVALREYARFVGDMACVVPFAVLEEADQQWREACANTGVPVNHYAEAWLHFSRVWQMAAAQGAPVTPAPRREPRGGQRGSGAGQDARGAGGEAGSGSGTVPTGGPTPKREREPRVRVCYRYNEEKPCVRTPCRYKHVCSEAACRGQNAAHPATRCPKRAPAGNVNPPSSAAAGSGAGQPGVKPEAQ
jgi:hypothetical protein